MNALQCRSPISMAATRDSFVEPCQLGLADVSLTPRFGVKGPRAAEWLANHGITLPVWANSWAVLSPNSRILRLGTTEYLVEGDIHLIEHLAAQPRTAGVYPVLRQDAALVMSGPRVQELLRQVCNVNLVRLPDQYSVVLTSMAGVSVTVLAEQLERTTVFRLWCDGTYGQYLWTTLSQIAEELGGGPVTLEQLP